MRHVVWGVEVNAVPAGWEAKGSEDPFFAFACWEGRCFGGALCPGVHACVCKLAELRGGCDGAGVDGADEHAESLVLENIVVNTIFLI